MVLQKQCIYICGNKNEMKLSFDKQSFSRQIRQKRLIELNVGVRDIGKITGTSASTISRCENEYVPDLLNYVKICMWLGVPMHTFIKNGKK